MTASPTSAGKTKRHSVFVWPGIVFFFMGVSLTAVTVTVIFATSDGGAATEEAYYAKAVAWDDIVRERAASDALGWTPKLTFSDAKNGLRTFTLALTGRNGTAVPATEASIFAFHHAERKKPVEFMLTGTGSGVLMAEAPLPRPGLWEVRIRLVHGGDVFVHTTDVELP